MQHLMERSDALVDQLSKRLLAAKTDTEKRRIECVLLRVAQGKSAAQIAAQLGWTVGSVYVIHSRWAKHGDSIFEVVGRGGRRHSYMTPEDEFLLLSSCLGAPYAKKVDIQSVRAVYEQAQELVCNLFRQPHSEPSERLNEIDQHLPVVGWHRLVAAAARRALPAMPEDRFFYIARSTIMQVAHLWVDRGEQAESP
jgi:transposase